jgi:hypothetical protein
MVLVDQVASDFTSAGLARQVRAALAGASENGNTR